MGQQCKRVIECSSSMPMAWVPSPISQKRKIRICKIFLDLAFCFPIKEMEGSWWIVVSTSEFSQQEKASYPSGGVESIGQTMLSPVHWAEVAGKETNLCLSRGDLAIAWPPRGCCPLSPACFHEFPLTVPKLPPILLYYYREQTQ